MYCVLWGILGIIFIKLVYPTLEKILNKIVDKFSIKLVRSFVGVFMIFNITISSMAALRQKERIEDIPADDGLDRFLDNMYPDEYMDEVFANKKYV